MSIRVTYPSADLQERPGLRRLVLYLEEALKWDLQWVMFEPNDQQLWTEITLAVDSFLQPLFRVGELAAMSYQVMCDASTTNQADIDVGVVNIIIRIAPVVPSEFIVMSLQLAAGQATAGAATPNVASTAHRDDPYKNFKCRLKWNGIYVAAVSKVSGLARTTEPIRLERGLTCDPDFEAWAHRVFDFQVDPGARAAPRRDLILEFYDEAGRLARSYNIYRCWPSEFQTLPELDASANAVAIQTLVLQHEGCELTPP